MDNSTFLKRFYAIAGVGAGVLLVLVWVFINGGLSLRGFAVAALIWWIAGFTAIFFLISSRQMQAEQIRRNQIASGVPSETIDQDRCVKNIRSMKRIIVVFAVLLGYGLLTSQGTSLLPRAAGAVFDVFLISVCVLSLMRSRRRLKEIAANSAKGSVDAK